MCVKTTRVVFLCYLSPSCLSKKADIPIILMGAKSLNWSLLPLLLSAIVFHDILGVKRIRGLNMKVFSSFLISFCFKDFSYYHAWATLILNCVILGFNIRLVLVNPHISWEVPQLKWCKDFCGSVNFFYYYSKSIKNKHFP